MIHTYTFAPLPAGSPETFVPAKKALASQPASNAAFLADRFISQRFYPSTLNKNTSLRFSKELEETSGGDEMPDGPKTADAQAPRAQNYEGYLINGLGAEDFAKGQADLQSELSTVLEGLRNGERINVRLITVQDLQGQMGENFQLDKFTLNRVQHSYRERKSNADFPTHTLFLVVPESTTLNGHTYALQSKNLFTIKRKDGALYLKTSENPFGGCFKPGSTDLATFWIESENPHNAREPIDYTTEWTRLHPGMTIETFYLFDHLFKNLSIPKHAFKTPKPRQADSSQKGSEAEALS